MTEKVTEEKVQVRAVARYVRISPYKARQVARLLKGKDVEEARFIVSFTPKHAARIIRKVLESAVANAENNNGLRAENLVVANCYVDEGPTLKRWRPRALGRATRIRKRISHITVVLTEKEETGKAPAGRRRAVRRKKG